MSSSGADRSLAWSAAHDQPSLVGAPVAEFLAAWSGSAAVEAAAIDPTLADTAAFCEAYGVSLAESANCVVVAGKRAGQIRYAACMVLATDRADVNGAVRRRLDVRKLSFLPMAEAVELTGMEYGGITPLGLPAGWPILVAPEVVAAGAVVIGSGIRASKLRLSGAALSELPEAEVLDGLTLS
jgi:prolyl-tRNA editing enzyme YbaK/EbsC (Cys-tRNA(Pro) deacylase)